jgi:hypothetical protein
MSIAQQAAGSFRRAVHEVEGGTAHVAEATNKEKYAWGWLILGMPPFLWALSSIILFILAISSDHYGGSITAFVFGVIFFFAYIIALSLHKTGRKIPF